MVAEYNCTVVRIALLYQYVSVESSHLLDAEDTDSTEGTSSYRQDLTLSCIRTQSSVSSRLKSEECDLAGLDVAFKSTSCDIRLNIRLKTSVHDELILHNRVVQYAAAAVAAVEAHECISLSIIELAFDVLSVNVAGNGIVDIQQSNNIVGYARQ